MRKSVLAGLVFGLMAGSAAFAGEAKETVKAVEGDTPEGLCPWCIADGSAHKKLGVEFTDEAIPLPSFRHPARAAYVFGSERGSLSPRLQALCRHIVKIPTGFCLNVATAGAIVMYDRAITMGRFGERPVAAGGPAAPFTPKEHHEWGAPLLRHTRPGERLFLKKPGAQDV